MRTEKKNHVLAFCEDWDHALCITCQFILLGILPWSPICYIRKKSFRGVWRVPEALKFSTILEEFILFREKSPPYSLLPYTIGVSEELELGCFCRRPGFCWQSIVEASKEEQGRRNQGWKGGNWPLRIWQKGLELPFASPDSGSAGKA